MAAADVQVLGPNQRKGNMVARLHGSGAHRPVLILGHLDVVEARREDWTTDPFQFVEKDGYFYGHRPQGGDEFLHLCMQYAARLTDEQMGVYGIGGWLRQLSEFVVFENVVRQGALLQPVQENGGISQCVSFFRQLTGIVSR